MSILLILLLILSPTLGHAAIAFVSDVEPAMTTGTSTVTQSVTVASGSDRLMYVCAIVSTDSGATDTPSVASITFNGSESFTLARADSRTQGDVDWKTEIWYLVAPTVTTADVVVTYGSGSANRVSGVAIGMLTGVNQSTPLDAVAGANGYGTTAEAVITTVASNAWIVDCAMGDHSFGLTVGASQTARTDRTGGPIDLSQGVSTVDGKASPGAETMDWTQAGSEDWVLSVASFAPSGGASPPPSSPSQATLSWTNGTDGVGVTGATIRRCVGDPCTPTTTLTTVSASNGSSGLYVDSTLAANTSYCYSVNNFDVAGNQSPFTAAACTTTGTTYRTTLATDTFTRADSTDLGSSWDAGYTGRQNCQIISGRVRGTLINSGCTETYNGVATPDDQWVRFTVPSLNGAVLTIGTGMVRWANSPTMTGYRCQVAINPTYWAIEEVTAGTPATLAVSTDFTHQVGDIYRCEDQGSALRLYQIRGTAETLLLSASDGTITSGKVGLDLYTATSGSLADLEYDLFAMGGFSTTPDATPQITGLTLDATGANLTYNATTPTQIRVNAGNNVQSYVNVIEPIASFPAGRYTRPWQDGLTYACFYPIDSLGIEHTGDDSRCASLTGIVGVQDTTPPTLTNCTPTTAIPYNSTEWTVTCELDKPASAKWHTSDVAYASMANDMTVASLVASATVTGLTNNSSTTIYMRAQSTDTLEQTHPMTTSATVTITVPAGAAADTTVPSTVTNLVATLQQTDAVLQWAAATDNVAVAGYLVYQSAEPTCTTYAVAGDPVLTTTTQISLFQNTVYCWKVKAIDTSNNVSAAFSNIVTLTTASVPDVTPPSDMSNLQIIGAFTGSLLLTWNSGTDDRGPVTTSIERCLVVAPSTDCSNFGSTISAIAGSNLAVSLAASSTYCFRGRHSDQAGNVSAYSNTVCGTTLAEGLTRPRLPVSIGLPRLPRN